MARQMASDDAQMFRAVIVTTVTHPDGREPRVFTEHYGPYRTKGAASSAITYQKKHEAWYIRYNRAAGTTREVSGYVERAETVWRRVD